MCFTFVFIVFLVAFGFSGAMLLPWLPRVIMIQIIVGLILTSIGGHAAQNIFEFLSEFNLDASG